MSYSQNEAAFYYAEQNRMKKADHARKAAGKGSSFGDTLGFLLLFVIVGLIGAVINIFKYLIFHISAFFDVILSYIPFL